MSALLRRAGALVATVALTGAGLAVTTVPAQAAGPDPRPVSVGASWLAAHLVGGVIQDSYVDEHGNPASFDDLGLTMDTAMSLVAVGGHASTVASIKSAMDARITETYDSFGTTYTGSAAKAAVYDRLVGGDPTDVGTGHTDLVKVVEDNTDTAAPVAGRLENVNDSFGDTNTFGQAFAVRALAEAGSTKAADAESFLLEQQCDDGFFRLNPNPDRAAQDQSCQADVGTDASAPDTDATAIAVVQLQALTTKSAAVNAALYAAAKWLLAQQHADGSFGGGPSTSAPNANSTGLAGLALAGVCSDAPPSPCSTTAAAKRAAVWVRSLQADEVGKCTSKLSDETGGIGYDASTVADGRADGITAGTKDRWLRTTAPVLPILRYVDTASKPLDIAGPSGYVKAGSSAAYKISGVAPGDKICVAGFGRHKFAVSGLDGTARVYFTTPMSTGLHTVLVSDRGGNSSSVRTYVLGAKKLTVTPSPSVAARGTTITVSVSGLAAGEPAKVVFRGAFHYGHADPHGVFRVRLGVGTTTGVRTVSAYGLSADRKGSHTVKVVR